MVGTDVSIWFSGYRASFLDLIGALESWDHEECSGALWRGGHWVCAMYSPAAWLQHGLRAAPGFLLVCVWHVCAWRFMYLVWPLGVVGRVGSPRLFSYFGVVCSLYGLSAKFAFRKTLIPLSDGQILLGRPGLPDVQNGVLIWPSEQILGKWDYDRKSYREHVCFLGVYNLYQYYHQFYVEKTACFSPVMVHWSWQSGPCTIYAKRHPACKVFGPGPYAIYSVLIDATL